MKTEMRNSDRQGVPGSGKKTVEPQAQSAGDLCRCKETALMKPRQLFRLMLDDLSFWKKKKKG